MVSNQEQIKRGFEMVASVANKRVGVLGFSFKPGTDDLRESPIVELIEMLLGKGYELRIYDQNVNLATLMGANRDYILNHIPHIARLMTQDIDDVLGFAQTIVIGNESGEIRQAVKKAHKDQVIIDLVRITDRMPKKGHYNGICW